MDKAQGSSKLLTPLYEVEDYCSSDSSSASLKQGFQSETEAESSKIVVMLAMTIGTNNLEEEIAVMKLQEENIARLTRKLEKQPARSLAKSSESEEKERTFIQSEASDEEVCSKKGGQLKNGGSPNLITLE